MKRALILTIAILSLLSCSDDEKNLDPIIGSWYLFSNGNTEVDNCKKKSTLIFNENGNFSLTQFELINNKCELDDTTSGTWKNKTNNVYTIYYKERPTGEDSKIEFSDNNNTMKVVNGNLVYKRK